MRPTACLPEPSSVGQSPVGTIPFERRNPFTRAHLVREMARQERHHFWPRIDPCESVSLGSPTQGEWRKPAGLLPAWRTVRLLRPGILAASRTVGRHQDGMPGILVARMFGGETKTMRVKTRHGAVGHQTARPYAVSSTGHE